MAFHPTLPYFAFMEPEGTICVMHSESWNRLATLADTDDYGVAFAFDPSRPRIVLGCVTGRVVIWDIALQCETFVSNVSGIPFSISYSSDAQLISVVCDTGSFTIIDSKSGAIVQEKSCEVDRFEEVFFSPSHPYLISVTGLGQLALWDASTFQLRSQRPSGLSNVHIGAVSKTTPLFAVRSSDGPVIVWNYIEDEILARIDTPPGKLASICFSADGQRILIGNTDQCVRISPIIP